MPVTQPVPPERIKEHVLEKPVFARMNRHVREHNNVQTKLCHTIRGGARLTLNAIVNEYIKAFRAVQHLPQMADSDELPSLRTNRPALSALTGACERTIYNHIALLWEAGFVVKVWHGRKRDFELWINPWIVLGDCCSSPTLTDLHTSKTAYFQPDIRQTLPPKNTLETVHNCLISGVDLSISSQKEADRAPTNPRLIKYTIDSFTLETAGSGATVNGQQTIDNGGGRGAGGVPQPLSHPNDNGGQRAGNGSDITTPNQSGSAPTKPIDAALYQYQKSIVLSFWQLAQSKFWPDDIFSADHTKEICNRLWTDVFSRFEGADSKTLSVYFYQQRVEQLDKAERYIRKHKWSSVIPPKLYFSKEFHIQQLAKGEKGNFHYTTAWQLADVAARQKLDKDRELHNAVRSVLDEKAPRGLTGGRSMNRIALYQYWINRLKRTADLDTMTRFNEQVSNLVAISSPFDFTPC